MNPNFKTVLVTGGAGYVGNVLTPRLLKEGYKVIVYDMLYFGKETLPLSHPNLTVIQGDIRDTAKLAAAFKGVDAVLNLACISNDASFELNDAGAGYYISREPVAPSRVTPIDDLLAALLAHDVELRVMPSLWRLCDTVVASSLQFSIIRMRNAQPREELA